MRVSLRSGSAPKTAHSRCNMSDQAIAEHAAEPSAATWFGFVLMCLGMFMAILDIQVVATSMPTIQHALAISPDAISWIQTAYLIAEIIAIPLTGWLTRVLTLRWLFVGAIGLFTLASIGCAFSGSFATLIGFRVFQGFAGGTLIPAVFSAVFLLFPVRLHSLATTIAGIMAVLAPTIGPIVGGWITDTYSWHWLFLINVVPGVIATTATPLLLPREKPRLFELATLAGFSLRALHPLIALSTLGTRSFAIGCALSFCLGIGLFGSVYLMPVFLAFVRRHDAFEIGTIMLVTGTAQLVAAPIAGLMESRYDPRWQSAVGFGLFAIGLGASAWQSRVADFDEMFWPQVLRGIAIMFCLLPPTRLALGALTAAQVPDASGLFNLMRNLGGAIGIALIDTILYGRTAGHAEALRDRLLAGDVSAARAIGLDVQLFTHRPAGVSDATVEAYVRPMVEKAAFALSANEAWALLAGVALGGLVIVPFAGATPQRTDAGSNPN